MINIRGKPIVLQCSAGKVVYLIIVKSIWKDLGLWLTVVRMVDVCETLCQPTVTLTYKFDFGLKASQTNRQSKYNMPPRFDLVAYKSGP